MIRHQTIRVQDAAARAKKISQPLEIEEVIKILPKAALPIVAALHNVQSDLGDDETRLSRHMRTTIRAVGRLTQSGLRPQIS